MSMSWEALPQRQISNRGRNRRLRMERVAASSIEQDYDREEMVAPALNRRNTPGLNS